MGTFGERKRRDRNGILYTGYLLLFIVKIKREIERERDKEIERKRERERKIGYQIANLASRN